MGGSTKKAAAAAPEDSSPALLEEGPLAPPAAAAEVEPPAAPPPVAAAAPAAVLVDELLDVRGILEGCVRDLESYNFNRHALNPNLWLGVAERARRGLVVLDQQIAAARAKAG